MALFSKTIVKGHDKPIQVKLFSRTFPVGLEVEISKLEHEVNEFCQGKTIVAVRPSITSNSDTVFCLFVVEFSSNDNILKSFYKDFMNRNK